MDQPSLSPEIIRLARAIRFALVAFVLCISYFSVRASLSIGAFRQVFLDMLGGKPLPPFTVFVVNARLLLIAGSMLYPFIAVLTLFSRNLVNSFYVLGGLSLLTVAQFILLFNALSAPLLEIVTQMQGG